MTLTVQTWGGGEGSPVGMVGLGVVGGHREETEPFPP